MVIINARDQKPSGFWTMCRGLAQWELERRSTPAASLAANSFPAKSSFSALAKTGGPKAFGTEWWIGCLGTVALLPLEEITSRYSANKSPLRLTTVKDKVLKVYWWEQRKRWGLVPGWKHPKGGNQLPWPAGGDGGENQSHGYAWKSSQTRKNQTGELSGGNQIFELNTNTGAGGWQGQCRKTETVAPVSTRNLCE